MIRLPKSVPVFVSPIPSWECNLHTLSDAAANISPVMKIRNITCHGELMEIPNQSGIVLIKLKMWDTDTTAESPYIVSCVMPVSWTKRSYLGMLELSITRNKLISIESIEIDGAHYKSINDLHHYFNIISPDDMEIYLTNQSAFYNSTSK